MLKDIRTCRQQSGLRTGARRWRAAGAWLAILALCAAPVRAAETEEPGPVHWAFSAFFGTGWYQVKDNQSVFVMRIPPRQTLRKASIDDEGNRRYGLEIHYPLTLGLHNVDDLPGVIDPDNFGTVSFTPGVTVEIPVSSRWYLRANAHVGWGKETGTDNSAWIYYGSLKSRVSFDWNSLDGAWLSAVRYAAYKTNEDERSDLASFMLGAELNRPLRRTTVGGTPLILNWHLTYDWLFDEVDFILPRQGAQAIDDQWELGLALSKGEQPFRLWFMKFQRVGLALRWSTDGKFWAVSLNLRSPFTR